MTLGPIAAVGADSDSPRSRHPMAGADQLLAAERELWRSAEAVASGEDFQALMSYWNDGASPQPDPGPGAGP